MAENSSDLSGPKEIAKQQQKLHKQIVSAISKVLRDSNIDPTLKVLISLGLIVLIGISSVILICVLNIFAHLLGNTLFNATPYIVIIAMHIGALLLLAFPILSQAQSLEHAIRITDNFDTVLTTRSSKK